LARGEAGTARGLTLAVKGGHNAEHHNHNDVGGVVVALNGVPVIVDPGRPTYTAQTFGPDRYEIWTMQSSWHTVPEIRGTAQASGAQFRARDVTPHLEDEAPGLSLDIGAAYPAPGLVRWHRDARLERSAGRVRVTDEWELQPADGEAPTRVCLMIAGEVEVGEGRAVVEGVEGTGRLLISWSPRHAPATATVRALDDPWLTQVWGETLTRLEIDVTALGPVAALVWTAVEMG
jgi:hypothetical protein